MKQTARKVLTLILTLAMLLGVGSFTGQPVEAAAKAKNTVIYMDEWPDLMNTRIASYVDRFVSTALGKSSTTQKVKLTKNQKAKDFINAWNAMPSEQEVVVIACHGDPNTLMGSYQKEVWLDRSTINQLKYKKIRYIVLLGCDAGHYDYRSSNIARALADRTKATVIAADGTVESTWTDPKVYHQPLKLSQWYTFTSNPGRALQGWLAYVPNNNDGGRLYQIGSGTINNYEESFWTGKLKKKGSNTNFTGTVADILMTLYYGPNKSLPVY